MQFNCVSLLLLLSTVSAGPILKSRDKGSKAPAANLGLINFCDHFPKNFAEEIWNDSGCAYKEIGTPGVCNPLKASGLKALKAVSKTHAVECRFFVKPDCTGSDSEKSQVAFSSVTTRNTGIEGTSWSAWKCVEAPNLQKEATDKFKQTMKENPLQTVKGVAKLGLAIAKNTKISFKKDKP
ncbi:hypothetical protein C8J56DRAFT_1171559 [Mycena floridula]|nr:hypothetical protein C8J56DRAFT_1171559 [Mycena floridula]